ncbi:MAG: DUF3656 domain-containing protein [Bdellovibrio sp.]
MSFQTGYSQGHMKKAELLLPVGDYQTCLAAIHNGADAIYLGVPHFNARGRSKDHTIAEIKEIIELCHLYDVDVHLAFNVLIFEDELETAKELLKELIPLRPDAFIVQDLGLVKMIKEMAPAQVVHASTQMTVTNHNAIELLSDLDIHRFVLGRENSIDEIRIIKSHTEKEIEVFVHGALCVAYSGQCFTSESIGGRSANRGQCAQSCRFEYKLLVDGEEKSLNNRNYLVSPKDLASLEFVPELKSIGVDSFKIEGRLKGPQYVASAAHYYRSMIDEVPFKLEEAYKDLSLSYSRGFFSGWMKGVDHQQLVDGRYSAHRGIELGPVKAVTKNSELEVESKIELSPGMGILIANGKKELGSSIYQAKKIGTNSYLLGLDKNLDLTAVKIGSIVFLNSSPAEERRWQKSVTDKTLQKRIPLDLKLIAREGDYPTLKFKDKDQWFSIQGDQKVVKAQKPLNQEIILKELSALSATPFLANEIVLSLGDSFISQKEVKVLRQKMTEFLVKSRTTRPSIDIKETAIAIRQKKSGTTLKPRLNLLLRNKDQVETLCFSKIQDIGTVYLDFEFGKDYAHSLEILRQNNYRVGIATTRILKPKEYHNLNLLIRLRPDCILVRNLGAIDYLKKNAPEIPLIGDYSLNVANSKTANYLMSKGLTRLSPGLDLNQQQLMSMLENFEGHLLEIIIYQYMPSFHMEHCVFAAFLSKGSSFKDCGKPCEKHKVELLDQFGNAHFIKADQECRNTMFNAKAQTSAAMFETLVQKNVVHFRLEALDELGKELVTKIENFVQLMSQPELSTKIALKVGAMEKYGIGTGQLFGQDNYLSRKKDPLTNSTGH